MDHWDYIMIAIAGYAAVASLVRLMANRRDQLVAKVREEIAKQRASAPDRAEQEAG